jgi:hypothetical protein
MQSLSSEREKMLRLMAYTISQLREETGGTDRYKDLLAFLALTSKAIINSVETTINAWEKRGYWIKADHFRDKWKWIINFYEFLIKIIQTKEWNSISQLLENIEEYTSAIKIPKKQSYGEPWVGAFKKLNHNLNQINDS